MKCSLQVWCSECREVKRAQDIASTKHQYITIVHLLAGVQFTTWATAIHCNPLWWQPFPVSHNFLLWLFHVTSLSGLLVVPTVLTFFLKYLFISFLNWMSERSEFHLAYKICVCYHHVVQTSIIRELTIHKMFAHYSITTMVEYEISKIGLVVLLSLI